MATPSPQQLARSVAPHLFGEGEEAPDMDNPRPYFERLSPWNRADGNACFKRFNRIGFCLHIRKGTPVRQGERRSRGELSHALQKERQRIRSKPNAGVVHVWNDGSEHPPSFRKYENLQRTILRDLMVEELAQRKWIHVRTISPALAQGFAILVVVEDMSKGGDKLADNLLLHGLLSSWAMRDRDYLDYFLPVGSILTIKQPYLTLQDGLWTLIRSDHPGDVMIKRPTEQWTRSAMSNIEGNNTDHAELLNDKGKELMKQGRVNAAVVVYSEAVSELKPGCTGVIRRSVLLNPAAACLEIAYLDYALSSCDTLLKTNSTDAATILLKAKTWYALRDFQNASAEIKEYLELNQHCAAGLEMSQKIQERIKEETCGTYDFVQMYENAERMRHRDLDYASWIGPCEVLRCTNANVGRGLIATRDIAAGELVLCEKAFMLSHVQNSINQFNILIPSSSQGPSGALIHSMAHHCHHNPTLRKQIGELFCVECKLNEAHNHSDRESRKALEHFALHRMIPSLWIQGGKVPVHNNQKTVEDIETLAADLEVAQNTNRGIWTITSYINHSCVSNVNKCVIGDMLCVRAHRPIANGEEILISYCDPFFDIDARQAIMNSAYGFICECKLCEAQTESDPDLHHIRKYIFGNFQDALKGAYERRDKSAIKEAELWESRISNLYRGTAIRPEIGKSTWLLDDALRHYGQKKLTSDRLKWGLEISTGADLTGWRKFEPQFLNLESSRLLAKLVQRLREEGKLREARRVKKILARQQFFTKGFELEPAKLNENIERLAKPLEVRFVELDEVPGSEKIRHFWNN